MASQLLSSDIARGRTRLVFTQTEGSQAFGPFVEYRPNGEDVNAFLAAHAAALLSSLKQAELGNALSLVVASGSLAVVPLLKWAATTDVGQLIREFYKTAVRLEAIMVGDYLNTLTDAQLRSIFSLTQAQVNSLRSNKLGPAATEAVDIRASSGA